MQRMLAYADRKLHIKTSQTGNIFRNGQIAFQLDKLFNLYAYAEKYGGHKPVEPQLFRTHSSYDNADYVKADRIISGDACYE